MKNYTITVNGISYNVQVEENIGATSGVQVAPVSPQVASAPPVTPTPQAAPKQELSPGPAASGEQGSIEVESPMPGKILSAPVKVGQAICKGDVIVILEAMKMENEIVAAEDGTIASVNVTTGQMVEAGDLIATLN